MPCCQDTTTSEPTATESHGCCQTETSLAQEPAHCTAGTCCKSDA